jgi:hypothetical protein
MAKKISIKMTVKIHYKDGTSESFNANGFSLEDHICDIYLPKKISRPGIPNKINMVDIYFNKIKRIEIIND